MLFGRKKKKDSPDNPLANMIEESDEEVDVTQTLEDPPTPSAPPPPSAPKQTQTESQKAVKALMDHGDELAERKKSDNLSMNLEDAGLVKKPGGISSKDEAAASLSSSVTVGETLDEGFTSEDDMLQMLSEQIGMPFIKMADYEDNMSEELINIIPSSVAQMYKIFPLEENEDGSVLVAMVDPLNVHTLDDVSLLVNRTIHGAIANEEDILDFVDELYGQTDESVDDMLESLKAEELELDSFDEDNFDDLERIANQAPIIKLVNLILLQSIKDRASDLHIEPFQNSFRIRYRVDGTLHETVPPPKHLQLAVISRFKIMASLNIAERRLPQDGRIKLSMSDREIDLRVSTLPTVNGESIVMRILDKNMMMIGLEEIGLMPEDLEVFEKAVRKPHGILLVTGPTGCGKTTTLYAALSKIYSPMLKIITTENPVEYQLDGVVQVNINERVGLTFGVCLRSILRQDPDVIMVGEIRDLETAQISIESALTGHLVLSTLHTNDAPGAITRLIDMNVEAFLVTSSVECILAQRLVRTICTGCREPYEPPEEIFLEMDIDPEDTRDLTFFQGRGCTDCNYSGYRGRIGVFEIFTISDPIKELILEHAPTSVIRRQARKDGMRSMMEDGWEKVVRGVTALEEVFRETQ